MQGIWITVGAPADAAPSRPLPATVAPSARIGGSSYAAADNADKNIGPWQPIKVSADAAILPDKQAIDARASDLARNNGFALGIHQTRLDNVIGPMGLRLSPKPDYRALGRDEAWADETADIIKSEFSSWANDPQQCDAAGQFDFADHQTIAFLNCATFGDSFELPLWLPEQGRRWNLRLQGVQPSRCINPYGQQDQAKFRGGIESDDYGAAIRYHFANRNPDDGPLVDWESRYKTEAVDAFTAWGRRRVIHAIDRREFGQTRGIGALTPILAKFKKLDTFMDLVMQQQLVANLFGIVLETEVDDLLGLFQDKNAFLTAMASRVPPTFKSGGNVLQLRPGEKATQIAPQLQGVQLEQFVGSYLREVCAGTSLPYELVTKDFSKSSYVGIRAGLAEAVRTFTSSRVWFADVYCQPIYELWFEEAVNSGRIKAPGYYENRHAYTRANWLGARNSFTDRVKETTAAVLAIENNLSTHEEEISIFCGRDWKDVFDQRAREVAYAEKKKLPTVSGPAAVASAGAPQTDPSAPPADQNKQGSQ